MCQGQFLAHVKASALADWPPGTLPWLKEDAEQPESHGQWKPRGKKGGQKHQTGRSRSPWVHWPKWEWDNYNKGANKWEWDEWDNNYDKGANKWDNAKWSGANW